MALLLAGPIRIYEPHSSASTLKLENFSLFARDQGTLERSSWCYRQVPTTLTGHEVMLLLVHTQANHTHFVLHSV